MWEGSGIRGRGSAVSDFAWRSIQLAAVTLASRSTFDSSTIGSYGITRYSSAPALYAFCTSSRSPFVDRNMIGISLVRVSLLSRLMNSMPSIPGSTWSTMISVGKLFAEPFERPLGRLLRHDLVAQQLQPKRRDLQQRSVLFDQQDLRRTIVHVRSPHYLAAKDGTIQLYVACGK